MLCCALQGIKPPCLLLVQSKARADELYNELRYDGAKTGILTSGTSNPFKLPFCHILGSEWLTPKGSLRIYTSPFCVVDVLNFCAVTFSSRNHQKRSLVEFKRQRAKRIQTAAIALEGFSSSRPIGNCLFETMSNALTPGLNSTLPHRSSLFLNAVSFPNNNVRKEEARSGKDA